MSVRRKSQASVSRLPLVGLLFLVAILGAFPFVVAIGFYGYLQIFERIVPGVKIGDLDLTWQRIAPAAAEINTQWNVAHKLTVSDGMRTWQVYPNELGLSVDGYQTAERAYEVGRFQPVLTELSQIATSMFFGWQVAPEINLDPDVSRAGLEQLNSLVSQPPRNATIMLVEGKLQAVPGELGYQINIDQTLAKILENPQLIMLSEYLQLQLQPITPEVSQASELLSQAETLLEQGFVIHVYDPVTDETTDWQVSQDELATWFIVLAEEEQHKISLDPGKVASYLRAQGEALGGGRFMDGEKYGGVVADAFSQQQPARIAVNYHPETYEVKKGETLLKISWKLGFPLWKILEANPGLDPDRLYSGQTLVVPPKDAMLSLPPIPGKRIVISISKQRLMVYQDGKQIHNYIISTGIDRSPTQPGIFQVLNHKQNAYASVWDLTMPNFLGIYEAWPGFMNGIHGLPMLSNGTRLWANILGKPASYGCIILDLPESKDLYQWAEDGVVVEIKP